MEPALERRLGNIERLLKTLIEQKQKPVWVKATEVIALTGWDKEKLRRMRQNGVIGYKYNNGHWYDLNSIPAQFIKVTS